MIIKHKGRRLMNDRDVKQALGTSNALNLDIFE
jgi:hypothetical protein